MEQPLIAYFTAEKQEALLFMLVGAAALAVSAWLYRAGGRYRGMLYPLAAIAVIQVTVGSTVYFRTDSQLSALRAQYASAPATFHAEEKRRMETVTRNFVLYRWIEILLLLTSIALIRAARHNELWHAVGIGLAIQAALMLALDFFAERRADEYLWFVMGVTGT